MTKFDGGTEMPCDSFEVDVLGARNSQPEQQAFGNELRIVLRGDLAAILSFAADKKKPGHLSGAGLPGDLVSPVIGGCGDRI